MPSSARAFRALSVLLLLTATVHPATEVHARQPEEIELPAFIARLERIAAAIEHASRQDAASVITAMPSHLRVRAGADRVDVSLEGLAERVVHADSDEEWPEHRRRIHARLLELSGEAGALLGEDQPPPFDAARTSLATVLARKEFARPQSAWSDRVRQRLRAWLQDLWSSLGGEDLDTRRLVLLLAWFTTAAALGGMALWAYRAAGRMQPAGSRPPEPRDAPPATARAWALRACDAARSGQTLETVRCTYRAAVKRLEEQGVWRMDGARTAREYVTLLQPGETRGDIVRDIVAELERAVYANQPVSRDDVRRLTAHLEALGCLRAEERPI